MPNFTAFDATDRTPRLVQAQTLQRLDADWASTEAFALILPTGSGKSALARAIQVATGADIITPSNVLVSQYSNDYPYVNSLKGKAHYNCRVSSLSCKDWQSCGFDACHDCPYEKAKQRVFDGDASFYNPMSFYYFFLNNQSVKAATTLVIDEAHQLPSMILMLCGKRLKRSDFKFTDKCCNELYLIKWIKDQIDRLDRLTSLYIKRGDYEKAAKCKEEIETLCLLKDGLEEDPQNYVIWITHDAHESYLNIRPLFPPKFLLKRIVGNKKLILMSGTLFDHDIRAIVGDRPFKKIEQPSPIPKENRRIYWKPAPFPVNYKTDPRQLAAYISSFVDLRYNTLVHSTYALSKRLAPYMPIGTIINDQDNKDECLSRFKEKGGLFLASGCAEGLDLKGDLCRVNIEPSLSWPQLIDPTVAKRKAMQDGQRWYGLETLKTSIQRSGRSTRAPDDQSIIINLDPNFKRLVMNNRADVPKYFLESIDWGGK